MNQTQKGIAMERIYAYRLLGLREGASQKQIDAAYDERRRKYKSPDYQDEPEYAARKMRELQEAYIMLGGSAPKAAAAAAGGTAAEKLQSLAGKLELPKGSLEKALKKVKTQKRGKADDEDAKKVAGFVLAVILMILSFLLNG